MEGNPLELAIAIKCDRFIIIMADTKALHHILAERADVEKIVQLENKTVLVSLGQYGALFTKIVQAGMNLYQVRSNKSYPVDQTAKFITHNIRKNSSNNFSMETNVLLAVHNGKNLELFRGDLFGTMVPVPFAYIGVCGILCVSLIDKYYKTNMKEDEAYDLLRKCVSQIKRRTILSYPKFQVRIIDNKGNIRSLPDLIWSNISI